MMNDYRKKKDEECVKRGDVHEMLVGLSPNATMTEIIFRLHNIPAVPQEMSAREYVRELLRLQNKRKTNCTLDDMLAFLDWEDAMAVDNVDNAVSIIEKWAREHLEEANDAR